MAAYPGAYKDFICVASVGPDGTPAPYSNYSTPSGSENMITAPGGDGEGTKTEDAGLICLQCQRLPLKGETRR